MNRAEWTPKTSLFHILFLGIISYSALGQHSPTQPIINYSHKEYRAGSQNWGIIQNNHGLLFFANNDGLLCYDGQEWQLRQVPNYTIIRSICYYNERIYVGAEGEFGYFSPDQQGILAYHSLLDQLPEPMIQQVGDVWDIQALNGKVFFRTTNQLLVWDEQSVQIVPFPKASNFMGVGPDQAIILQIGVTDFYQFQDGKLKPWKNWDLIQSPVSRLIQTQEGEWMFLTLKDGVFELNQGELLSWSHPWNEKLKTDWINDGCQLRDGRMAFGTLFGGLLLIDPKTKEAQRLNKDQGLQKNNVLSLFQDLSGDLWIGTDRGIDYLQISSPFHLLQPDTKQQAAGYAVAKHDNTLFLGTSNGIYTQMNAEAPFRLLPRTSGQIWGLGVYQDQLLAGHFEGTLLWQNGQFVPLQQDFGTWTFRPLNDSILVVGRYEGISFLRFENGTWRPYGELEGFKISSRLVEIDPQNQWIWVSHPYQGVYRIRLEECCSPSPTYQLDYFGEESGLPSKLLNHIFWINGTLVVGGESGVYEFDAQTEQFISYEPLAERLDSLGRIKWLKEDEKGNIWFLAGEELGILALQDRGMERTWERKLFTGIGDKLVNGFEMIEPIPGYGVVLGSEDGFLQYAPHIAEIPDTGFRTILKEVRLGLGSDSILFQGGAISSPQDMVELAHHQSSLLFQFTGTSYRSTSRLAFQYRLIGLDDAWSNWTPKSEKEFTSLPPGEYQFEVRARKGREILTPKEVFAFRIAPPWYATRLAYSIYGCLGLISLGSVLGLQRTRFELEKAELKARQRQLEEVHQEEVRESEERISQLKNEKLHAEVQHKNQELAMATMHLVQKGEILSTLQTELKKILLQHRESSQLNRSLKDLVKLVQQDQRLDDEWERFAYHFDQVHSDFLKRLKSKYPDLSPNDFRLCSYLRMNLTSKEIAPLMNISVRGVEASRYRLRKKLQLPSSTNLQEFILRL